MAGISKRPRSRFRGGVLHDILFSMATKSTKESIALYRKYRPHSFNDVLGQEHIVSVLESAVAKSTISHAYLFAGSRGTGKTSVARIFAHAIGTSGKDFYEIDAASNRGIDDIRELRDGVAVLPFDSKYKVYIIDEVHMLTKEAFNALLKTLEEPPSHAVFILATTEFDKLPETIVSRCQSFTFRKPSTTILKEMVLRVAQKEGLAIDPASADLIAVLADGSFRDAHGILQKIVTLSTDTNVSIEEVERVTGAPRGELVDTVLRAIVGSDLQEGLKTVRTAVLQNVDIKVFLKLLLQKVRTILLLRYATDLEKELRKEYTENDFNFLKELAGGEGSPINSETLKALLVAYDDSGRSYMGELPLELALIDIVKQKHL